MCFFYYYSLFLSVHIKLNQYYTTIEMNEITTFLAPLSYEFQDFEQKVEILRGPNVHER